MRLRLKKLPHVLPHLCSLGPTPCWDAQQQRATDDSETHGSRRVAAATHDRGLRTHLRSNLMYNTSSEPQHMPQRMPLPIRQHVTALFGADSAPQETHCAASVRSTSPFAPCHGRHLPHHTSTPRQQLGHTPNTHLTRSPTSSGPMLPTTSATVAGPRCATISAVRSGPKLCKDTQQQLSRSMTCGLSPQLVTANLTVQPGSYRVTNTPQAQPTCLHATTPIQTHLHHITCDAWAHVLQPMCVTSGIREGKQAHKA